MRLIFVRSGSAILLSEFGERPVAFGDVVALGSHTLCGSEPEESITVTTIYLDRDHLVSVTENIDETPTGMLLHGIMSTIAEFYSRNLAGEVTKGLQQKAAAGGTGSTAPLGYLNVRERDPTV